MAIHVYDYKGQNRCCQLYRNDSQKICLRIILGLLVGGGGGGGGGGGPGGCCARARKDTKSTKETVCHCYSSCATFGQLDVSF